MNFVDYEEHDSRDEEPRDPLTRKEFIDGLRLIGIIVLWAIALFLSCVWFT